MIFKSNKHYSIEKYTNTSTYDQHEAMTMYNDPKQLLCEQLNCNIGFNGAFDQDAMIDQKPILYFRSNASEMVAQYLSNCKFIVCIKPIDLVEMSYQQGIVTYVDLDKNIFKLNVKPNLDDVPLYAIPKYKNYICSKISTNVVNFVDKW